jgi:hypothetical protein
MRKISIIIFLSFLLQAANAQVPGYMGLKCSLQYQCGISPQWNNLSQSFMPYLSHNVQLGYVVSRKYEVGLQYTRLDYSSDFKPQGYFESTDGSNTSTITMDHRTFTGNNVMLYMKFFRARKGFIAPLGRYYILGLSYQNSHDRFHVTNDISSPVGSPNYTNVYSHDVSITVGVGRNIILFNRLLITIEGDVNLPISSGIRAGLSQNGSSDLGIGPTTSHTPNAFKYNNAMDAMLVNLLQIKIGIGALLF